MFPRNPSIHTHYRENLDRLIRRSRHLAGRAAFRAGILVFILMAITSLPIFALNLYLVYTHFEDTAFLAAIMVTLPKQAQILTVFRAFYQQLTNLKIFERRFTTALANSRLTDLELEDLIDDNRVYVDGASIGGLENFLARAVG